MAFMLAVLPTLARRDNTGRQIQMKWEVNKLKFVFRCAIVGAVIAAGLLLSALIR